MYTYGTIVPSERVGFVYAQISDVWRAANPVSIHTAYIRTWRNRIIRPDGLPYNLSEPSRLDFSRGQSRVILALTGKKTKGFFLDVGAGDGETNSVTLGLELQAQWEGLLVEGDPIKFSKLLRKHRRAECLQAKILSGNKAGSSASNLELLPSDLFEMVNRTYIDLLNINLHGQELDFLWAVNLNLHTVKIVVIEMQADISREQYLQVTGVMARRGYRISHHIVDGRHKKKDIVFARD
ncbi:protein star [Plakobranchus ocellatus]|uniref:Protein star n=1 Tax=Plakobranchus ocellatus TaxID=259542 RepID=A0AAV4DBG1_9GAST|nr:protein star [Plakobranchus ocellatus]